MRKDTKAADTQSLDNTGDILSLIATGKARSRPAILEASGLSRVTVSQRLNALLASGLVCETATKLPSGGRPSRQLAINHQSGHLLVANIGETYIHLAAMDPSPAILGQTTIPFSSADSPATVLEQIALAFQSLTEEASKSHPFLFGIGLSLPTPVDFEHGHVVGPSVLPLWDEFEIIDWLQARFPAPVLVENDVNLMTLYEYRHNHRTIDEMVFIKAGTGIGSGFISNGRLFRGANGAAGDIGHMQFLSQDAPLCRCGKFGCIEARAGGWAIARDLSDRGHKADNARDVIDLVQAQTPEALMLLREAGRVLGEAVSNLISVINPRMIVIGGTLSGTGDLLLSGIRELVYQRCLPLATRDLQIVVAHEQEDMALFGAAHLVLETLFSPDKIDQLTARFSA